MRNKRRRIERLYQRRAGYWSQVRLPYLEVESEDQIADALAALPGDLRGPIKIYVGCGPSDWDSDNEAQKPAAIVAAASAAA